MKVRGVTGMTIHFKRGKSIYFGADEISVRLCHTTQKNSDGTVETPVVFYMVTTTLEERFIANVGTGADEGEELEGLG